MIKRTILRSLLIASSVVATATCAAAREGVFPNPRPDQTWGRTVGGIFTSGKSIAVVIAISNYIGARAGGYPALPTAKRDADKMLDFLLNDAGFDTVYLLTDEDATKLKIDKLMTDVIPSVVMPRDRFLFYWSGHGDQRFSGDGRAFGFLPLADSKSKEFYAMVSMRDLERWDSYIEARQALFVLDACLSGLAGFQTKAPLNARLEQLSLPARHLITAGTKDEFVISGDRWGGSLFTDSFILGAKGQARSPSGIVSLPVLLDFIQERVARERQLVNWSKSLTPQFQSLQYSEGYFFFTPVVPVGLPPSAATRQEIPERKGQPTAIAPLPTDVQRQSVPQVTKDPDLADRTLASSQGECEQRCTRLSQCAAFTFERDTGSCSLYWRRVSWASPRSAPTPQQDRLREYPVDRGWDIAVARPVDRLQGSQPTSFEIRSNMQAIGSLVYDVSGGTLGECEQRCTRLSQCAAFAFEKDRRTCSLYWRYDKLSPNAKFDSGTRR